MTAVLWSLVLIVMFLFFFFSSRRRHTRCLSDWSSDVCSSDLCAADPFIDFDEGSLQLAIVPKGLDLALGLALCRRRCEALGDCLAIHLVGQPQMRAVAWII